MADYASSPLAFQTVRPPGAADYAPPNFAQPLMQGLSQLPDQYLAGREMQQKLAMLRPVIDSKTGQLTSDPSVILNEINKRAGISGMQQFLPYMIQAQSGGQTATALSNLDQQVNARPGTSPDFPQGAHPGNIRGYTGEGDTKEPDTLRTLMTGLAKGQDVTPAIKYAASALGRDPDDPIAPADMPIVREVAGRALGTRTAESPVSSPGQEGETVRGPSSAVDARSNVPSSTPVAAGSAVSGAPAPQTNAPGTSMPASGIMPQGYGPLQAISQAEADPETRRLLQGAARAREIAARDAVRNPQASKTALDQAAAYEARAKLRLEAAKSAAEPTGPMKEAGAAGMPVPQYEGEKATYTKYGEAKGKRIGEVVEAGGMAARQTLRTLQTMQEALIAGGRNISTGPGAENWLKVKQAANNLFGPDFFKGVPESEAMQKLNAQLASESAKAMTARPSQLEFKAFMSNNPGLLTSVEGTKALISVLTQAKQQDIKLSRLAMNQTNLRNWSDVEDRFYEDNPIVGPWSEVWRNPKTGDRVVKSGGRWIPIPK